MSKGKQKVVRWRKVLKHMGACGTVGRAYRMAGKPEDLDGMVAFARANPDKHVAGQIVSFLEMCAVLRLGSKEGLSSEANRKLAKDLHNDYWDWESPVACQITDRLVAGVKEILEAESDARGLTEWI